MDKLLKNCKTMGKHKAEKFINCGRKAVLSLPLFCLFAVLSVKSMAISASAATVISAPETGETAAVPAMEPVALPTLIQSTSVEEDHRARLSLDLTGTIQAPEAEIQKAFGKVLSSCVRIQVYGHYGSGSIYKMTEQEVIIATNRHVLQYWDEDSRITFMNGTSVPGRILGVSDTADVGFVAVPIREIGYELLWFLHTVREADAQAAEELEEGTPYFAVDMASDWRDPVCREGMVVDARIWLEAFQMPMLLGKGTAVPGMSGGGVFDAYGNYLGMITGGSEEKMAMTAAVPVREIAAAYEQMK